MHPQILIKNGFLDNLLTVWKHQDLLLQLWLQLSIHSIETKKL